ncbi:hypothetical protein Lalb_Chr23g0269371 [Lupinus albus]|uniref:Uncharacterized protein n=1 Tax=Lupinus albus TaxID=3870 RepID=A0A6A4NC32_LUPAL|nr:hypothetical protein Lalb_Chr23g0269371 [Lupinus albus]
MDIKKYWLSSRSTHQTTHNNIMFGRSYTRTHYRIYSPISYDGKKTVWQMLWRNLKSGKKKVFSSYDSVDGVYDPETYSMNFDHGTGWMEPDNVLRSFSARFADPSRTLPPKQYLLV